MTQHAALARLDAEAVHLRPGDRGRPGRAGDADRGPPGRFRRLPAEEFRHELPGRRQRPPGAAAVAQRAGRSGCSTRSGRSGWSSRFRQAGVTPDSARRRSARPRHRARRRRHIAARSRPALHGPVERRQGEGAARRLRGRRARAARQRHGAGSAGRLAGHRHACRASGRRSGAAPRGIAYKTGTSYGNRDAWSVGYDGRHVLGVWVGRANSGSVPGISGYETAAPILFEGFRPLRPRRGAAPPPAGRRLPLRPWRSAGDARALPVRAQRSRPRRESRSPNPRRASSFRRTARASNWARRPPTPRRWC